MRPPDDELALAWRGSDPVAFSAALAAIRSAGIQTYEGEDHDQLAWGLAIPRPRCKIWVKKEDLERATECTNGVTEGPPLAFGQTPQWALEEDAAATSDDSEGEQGGNAAPDDIPAAEFKSEDATAEIWSGDDATILDMLQESLRENGIGSAVDNLDGKGHLRVMPESEARAKEIVREVVEQTPPE